MRGDAVKVHMVEMLVIDSDDLGADGVREVLEWTKYPNRCISPDVKAIETVEVEWSDDHPLNRSGTADAEYRRLFGKKTEPVTDVAWLLWCEQGVWDAYEKTLIGVFTAEPSEALASLRAEESDRVSRELAMFTARWEKRDAKERARDVLHDRTAESVFADLDRYAARTYSVEAVGVDALLTVVGR